MVYRLPQWQVITVQYAAFAWCCSSSPAFSIVCFPCLSNFKAVDHDGPTQKVTGRIDRLAPIQGHNSRTMVAAPGLCCFLVRQREVSVVLTLCCAG
ncbi:hypothetical protein GALMADRAFT_1180817 [Galerina marginata CBS 339.88]|uniref:Uncharacterized protein n=1 Tax=Galerina marginata (strain CBS 339.88) TaxID=685588 RepID=A0A067TCQ1_GALM3|nr:hypothetical protein GALMADRAFT_1180817 [Galerina marginata CBS 339.88]